MKSFRRWIFKFLTGYDLSEYAQVVDSFERALKLAISCQEDNKKILEHNARVIETNQRVLELSNKTIEDCRNILIFCEGMNANETLD